MTDTPSAAQQPPDEFRTPIDEAQRVLNPLLPAEELSRPRQPGKVAKFGARVAMAALAMIGPIDYMVSDAKDAAVYESIQETIEIGPSDAERLLENGVFFTLGVGEIALVGAAIGKSKKARGAFGVYDAYLEDKKDRRGAVQQRLASIANSPFTLLEKIGEKAESMRRAIDTYKNPVAKKTATAAVDAVVLNVLGTSATQLQETMAGKPPGLKRNLYFGALFSASWLAAAESIRTVYRTFPVVQPPMAFVGENLDMLVSPTNPVGAIFLGTVAAAMAHTGWRIEKYRQEKGLGVEELGEEVKT